MLWEGDGVCVGVYKTKDTVPNPLIEITLPGPQICQLIMDNNYNVCKLV